MMGFSIWPFKKRNTQKKLIMTITLGPLSPFFLRFRPEISAPESKTIFSASASSLPSWPEINAKEMLHGYIWLVGMCILPFSSTGSCGFHVGWHAVTQGFYHPPHFLKVDAGCSFHSMVRHEWKANWRYRMKMLSELTDDFTKLPQLASQPVTHLHPCGPKVLLILLEKHDPNDSFGIRFRPPWISSCENHP